MTVAELFQCGGWGFLAVLPGLFIAASNAASDDGEKEASAIFFMLALVLQVAFGVACYKAGIRS